MSRPTVLRVTFDLPECKELSNNEKKRKKKQQENGKFGYAFATDTPGGPKISMMVATHSIHGSIFAVVARRKGGQDDYVMKSFPKITSIGWDW